MIARPLLQPIALALAISLLALPMFVRVCTAEITEARIPLPELRPGEGTPPRLTEAMLGLGRAVATMHGDSLSEAGRMALDSVIVRYPEDPDARFLRATLAYCGLEPGRLEIALGDLDVALAQLGPNSTALGTSAGSIYSLRSLIELDLGRDQVALTAIQKAIELNPDDGEKVFNPGTVAPDSATGPCSWTKAKLDRLVARNPSDYRAHLARGLYFGFFKRFSSSSHSSAVQDLQAARRLAPTSAMCAYFLGREYASGDNTVLERLVNGAAPLAQQQALREFAAAIGLDPRFAPAYAERAYLRTSSKQYTLAIRDYDKVVELEPKNAGALNDRGLAKQALKNYWGAARDFAEAARLKTENPETAPDDATLYATFENLASCHAALGQFAEAADDMTKSLRALIAPFAAAWSIPRLRDLFPECASMTDETFLQTVHDAFCPTMPYETFEKLKQDGRIADLESTVIPTGYVQRGDYFLRTGNLRASLADYARARRAFPSSVGYTERWRLATKNDSQEFYIDSKMEPDAVAHHAIWVKVVDKRGSGGWTLERMTVDCGAGTLQVEAITRYGADGGVIGSDQSVGVPTIIVPESLGEWFSLALCR